MFMGVLALLSCGCQLLSRVYKYKILFLFNVIDYSRFLKSVFFHVTPLPCILTVPHPPPPIKERTSICKAVDTIRESCWHGLSRPVTIIVVVFCIAWYHESVNTVIPNLFIKTTGSELRNHGYVVREFVLWRREARAGDEQLPYCRVLLQVFLAVKAWGDFLWVAMLHVHWVLVWQRGR